MFTADTSRRGVERDSASAATTNTALTAMTTIPGPIVPGARGRISVVAVAGTGAVPTAGAEVGSGVGVISAVGETGVDW
jgi:hypothetical protein